MWCVILVPGNASSVKGAIVGAWNEYCEWCAGLFTQKYNSNVRTSNVLMGIGYAWHELQVLLRLWEESLAVCGGWWELRETYGRIFALPGSWIWHYRRAIVMCLNVCCSIGPC